MKWRWLFLGAFVVLGGCGATVVVLAHGTAADLQEQATAALDAELVRHGARFRADVARLAAVPMLQAASGKDAAALLNPKLPQAGKPGPVLPDAVRTALGDSPLRKFPAALMDLDVSAVDLGWMAALSQYAQWDPFTAPPIQTAGPLALHGSAMPGVVAAGDWCMARLLQGLHGDLATAGHQVDDLARLLFSTELVSADLAAVTCLRAGRRAWDHANSLGMTVGDWVPFDVATLDTIARVAPGFLAFADGRARPERADDVFTSTRLMPGRCAALLDTASILLEIDPLDGDLYDAARVRMGRLLAQTQGSCRLTPVRAAWGHEDQQVMLVGVDALCDLEHTDAFDCVLMSLFGHIPGLREVQVEAMYSSDSTVWLKAYNKP